MNDLLQIGDLPDLRVICLLPQMNCGIVIYLSHMFSRVFNLPTGLYPPTEHQWPRLLFLCDGPRPGPSHFQSMGRGPARQCFRAWAAPRLSP